MKTFILSGKLVSTNNKPLPGFKVSVWDKDKKVSDQLGVAFTDPRGQFKISFDESRFRDDPKDTLPDVFFLIYKGDHVIHTTEARPIKNASDLKDLLIQVNLPGGIQLQPASFLIKGKLVERKTQNPIPGLKVEAWDKDSKVSDHVGTAVSDNAGSFSIYYDESRFKDSALDDLPDIFFRIFNGEEMIHSSESKPLKNSASIRDLKIELDFAPVTTQQLLPRLPKDLLLKTDALKTKTPSQISIEQPDVYAQLQNRAILDLRQSMLQDFDSASFELKHFLRSIDFSSLGDQRVTDFISNVIEDSQLAPNLKKEGLILIADYRGSNTVSEVLQPEVSLAKNPLFQMDLSHAAIHKLGVLSSLEDSKLQHLFNRDISFEMIGPDTLELLVKEKLISKEEAASLNLNANLLEFAEGDTVLADLIKKGVKNIPVSSLKNLALFSQSDWKSLLEKASLPLNGEPLDLKARNLMKQVEILYPNEVFISKHKPLQPETPKQFDTIAPLFEKNTRLFGNLSFSGLDTSNLDPNSKGRVEDAYNSLKKQASMYPGIQLHSLFDDRKLSSKAKMEEGSRRVEMIRQFYILNDGVRFLAMDFNKGSKDLAKLNFGNLKEEDRKMIIENIKADQRIYAITKDADDTFRIKEAGYTAAYQIVADGLETFMMGTQIEDSVALQYYHQAFLETTRVGARLGLIFDLYNDPLGDSPVRDSSSDAMTYLREMNGYEDFFGSSDYCKCKHCQSIISPIAYFVDLMDFLHQNVIVRHFTTTHAGHILNPKVRRADLWSGLKLNCENTSTLLPYLIIINEILENFIATQPPLSLTSDLSDRNVIENAVYRFLCNETLPIHSFSQPFHLPLAELDTYLRHFPVSRAEIAQQVLTYEDNNAIITQAFLHLSPKEYDVINSPAFSSTTAAASFLSNVYRYVFPAVGTIPPVDVQQLLPSMQIKRAELTLLIKSYFVTANGSEHPEIIAEATRDSFQPNVERIRNLSLSVLDRMHRFTRLWKKSGLSITELDSLVQHLHNSMGSGVNRQDLMPDRIVRLLQLKTALRLNVAELCAFIYELPTDLFNKQFNLKAFVKAPEDEWRPESLSITFQHPAYRTGIAGADNTTNILNRLLAGLGVNDEELFLLIENLKQLTSFATTTTNTISLNRHTLRILFIHARLLKLMNVGVHELFLLLRIHPEIHDSCISGFEDLDKIVSLRNWWKSSNYSLNELAFILGETITENEWLDPLNTAEEVLRQIDADESLLFSNTIFSFFEGVTEAQSLSIIEANASVIIPADLRKYRITSASNPNTFRLHFPADIDVLRSDENRVLIIASLLRTIAVNLNITASVIPSNALEGIASLTAAQSQTLLSTNPLIFTPRTDGSFSLSREVVSEPTTIGLILPPTVLSELSLEEQPRLYASFLERIVQFMQAGAPEFSDRVLMFGNRLSILQSRAILDANPTFIEQTTNTRRYWLSAAFDFSRPLNIPISIPILETTAREYLHRFHASTVIVNLLENKLKTTSDKTKVLAGLAGFTIGLPGFDALLTQIAQGNSPANELADMIEAVQRLGVWFKDKIFEADTLEFIAHHSGSNDIFQIIRSEYLSPRLKHLQITGIYKKLRKESLESPNSLHIALEAFRFEGSHPQFADDAIPEIANALNTEIGIANALNQVLNFPARNFAGEPSNRVLEAMDKMIGCVTLSKFLGVGGETLPLIVSRDFDDLTLAVTSLVTAIRTKCETEEVWQKKIGPFEDTIREYKRDALSDYLIHTYRSGDAQWFKTTNDLYNYFLIDTELEGCARTSRVVAGISSLQLYIQRCQMNLEQSEGGEVHVLPENIPAEWEWRKNYRVWEANRKVFLYPENYIEPDLRDDKTELFKELESTLLQQEINAQNVLNAYSKYLKGFETVASLKIAGAYHDLANGADVLHLFGVTPAEPGEYYYKTIGNIYKKQEDAEIGIVNKSWQKLALQIPVRKVSPIVYKGKLYLFWSEVSTRPKPKSDWANADAPEYVNTMRIKFSSLQMDSTWTAPQSVIFKTNNHSTDSLKNQQIGSGEVDETYTRQDWDWVRVFPEIHERNHNLVLSNDLKANALVLYTREMDERIDVSGSHTVSVPVKRPLKTRDNRIHFTRYSTSSDAFKYRFSSQVWEELPISPGSTLPFLIDLDDEKSISMNLVNGNLSDLLINIDNDLLYLHSDPSDKPYAIKRFGTTLSQAISQQLFEAGIKGILNADYQALLREPEIANLNGENVWDDTKKGDIPLTLTEGMLSVYYREIFFHTPYLIANHLNSQGKFADAQKWYHYIFDPTANTPADRDEGTADPADRMRLQAKRVWQFIEFRNHTLASLRDQLNDPEAVQAYQDNPFNPHAIARLRLGAYMKNIVMKYIDNLLDWGDNLFAQDTMESINEATLLYVLASEILGKRPAELGDCQEETDSTYNELISEEHASHCEDFLCTVESLTFSEKHRREAKGRSEAFVSNFRIKETKTKAKSGSHITGSLGASESPGIDSGTISIDPRWTENMNRGFLGSDWSIDFNGGIAIDFSTSILKQACMFCIPANPDLLAYWERVEDRLFKIRNCMNISGIRRQLALFAPEIDPRLLVRARAAGLSLEDVLNSINGDLPPYRFSFLISKAKEYAGALQSYGGALMNALEKKDAEELARLRLVQQDNILKLTTKLRDMEVEAAEVGLESLRSRRVTVQNRLAYYQNLVNINLSDLEIAQDELSYAGQTLKAIAVPFGWVSAGAAVPPSILGMSFSSPSAGISNGFQTVMYTLNALGELSLLGSGIVGKFAGYERRKEGWQFSLEQAQNELTETERQIEAAEIRRDISIESKKLHDKTLEQQEETFEFYRDKFSNLGLYTWLSSQLQRMYRESYQAAMTIARMAERAYRFERNDDTTVLLDGNYWDTTYTGLLSGEKLMNTIRRMELRYMETHERNMEIDQAFSLTQIAPEALMKLKATGECEFTVPELYFDLFYPGQYRRRMKSARLTIPCITGPYSNVSATLTLKRSKIRKEPKPLEENLFAVNPSRSVTIATTTAQNDSGVFRLDFRDDRYMPFEGAGAVDSEWLLQLPKNFRPFDYSTINDVILHISYTAGYDETFRNRVEDGIDSIGSLLSSGNIILSRLFSLRQEFSQTFHRLLHSPLNEHIRIEFSEKHLPLFLQGKRLQITGAKLIVVIDENGFRDASGEIRLPSGSLDLSLNVQCNSTTTTVISSFAKDEENGMYAATIPAVAFRSFIPASSPLNISIEVTGAGVFAPVTRIPGDPSALDDHKVKDVNMLFFYRIEV